jgi:hypothetical protein
MRVTYNKLWKIRTERHFNDLKEEDRNLSAFYLGEDLIENAKRLDRFLSDENGGFDPNNPKHIRLIAKLDMLNDELGELYNTARV